MTYDWSKMVKMTVPVGLCGWQQRGSLTINGRTTGFPVGVETELPEPVAERVKALMADAEEKAEHVQPLKPWMQYVTGADGVARWEPRLAYAETEEVVILPETTLLTAEGNIFHYLMQPFSADLAEGMVCTVNYNGTEYKCSVEKVDNGDGTSFIALGNIAAMKDEGNTGEPFVLMAAVPPELASQGVYAQLIPIDEAESVTISITGVAGEVKTIDADKMGKNAGANKVLVTDANGEAVWSDSLPGGSGGGVIYINKNISPEDIVATAYADAACTVPLTYEQGKAIIAHPYIITMNVDGMTGAMVPSLAMPLDEVKKIQILVPSAGVEMAVLEFSDSID